MARKKLTMDQFEGAKMDEQASKAVKGGYKFGPSGAGFVGSFVWETIDIRNNQGDGRDTEDSNPSPEIFIRRHKRG